MSQANYTILLVDDDINSLNILAEIMRRDGYETISAIDGHDAIIKIRNNPVDVVILDFHLPDATGLHILEQIKHIQPNVPVIITSADPSPSILLDVHDAGAYSFIRKPADLNRVRQTVSKALSISKITNTQTTIQIEQQSVFLKWSRKIIWWKESSIESAHVENPPMNRGEEKSQEDNENE
jgi:DNA-binding NtrC family response regulator